MAQFDTIIKGGTVVDGTRVPRDKADNSGAHIKFLTLGVYPTDMLSWLVRDTGTLTLEEAHFRLSTLPAPAAQLKDRGTLREGFAADIVVYDL